MIGLVLVVVAVDLVLCLPWRPWGPERARAVRAAHIRVWRRVSPRLAPWVFRWRPARSSRKGVPLARRGVLGRWVRVRLAQHILITGVTGSGKSCVLLALAASARSLGMDVEFWDAKDGLEGQPYAVAGIPVIELEDQPGRLAELLITELPRRADILKARGARQWDPGVDGPELVVILDELGVSLGTLSMASMAVLIKKCRAYGVWIWAGEQLGKASTVDTDIRSQFLCRIALRTGRASDSRIVLGPEPVADGWAPHDLLPRWLLVFDPDHRRPCPARCATVSDALLTRYPMPHRVVLEKAPVTVSLEGNGPGNGNGNGNAAGSVVYLIGSEAAGGMVKIGRTVDVPKRLATFQTASPARLAVLWTTPGGSALEAALHREFAHRRRNGEWFDLGPDPVSAVRDALVRIGPNPDPGTDPLPDPSMADLITETLMLTPDPLSGREIARRLGSNPGTVHRALKKLAADGAVASAADGFSIPLSRSAAEERDLT
ncbi:GIY-YIG nuclease family protein [Streptomyces sp. NPDC093544]|uniref:GIY-YIG nuclease family protein n=1 Tax=Streptomyces sp. NPDC093544 TaxID=3155200 RepID=UPI00342CDF54